MQSINIMLYQFNELSTAAQQQVLLQQKYINVAYGYWYQRVYADFCEACSCFGVAVNPERISFRGFYLKGDGSTFDALVELPDFIIAIQSGSWKRNLVGGRLSFPKLKVNRKILAWIKDGSIQAAVTTQRLSRSYMKVNIDFDWNPAAISAYKDLEQDIIVLENWIEQCLRVINQFLYNSLQNTYEALISEQAIKDAIEANGYLFTVHGALADDLYNLANYYN